MRPTPLLLLAALALGSCSPIPPDPKLMADAERSVVPNNITPVTNGDLVSGIYFVVDSGFGYPRTLLPETLYLDPTPIVTVGNFKVIKDDESDHGLPELQVHLDQVGTARFHVASRRALNKRLAMVVDNTILMAPMVTTEIPEGSVSISIGNDPEMTALDYARLLVEERERVAPVQ